MTVTEGAFGTRHTVEKSYAHAMGAAGLLSTALIFGLIAALLLAGRGHLLVPLTLLIAATSLPAAVPTAVSIGGFSLGFYELSLCGAFLWAVSRRVPSGAARTVVLLALWLLLGTAIAWANDSAEFIRVVSDVRYPAELLMAVVVAAAAVRMPGLVATSARAMRVSLWVSVAFIGLAALGLTTLAGRSKTAAMLELGDGGGPTRYLTAATFFALASLAICLALAVHGRMPLSRTWTWWLPAVLILFLAFSRNHLLGIAVTVLVAIIGVRSIGAIQRALIGTVAAAALIGMVVAIAPALSDVPGGKWFAAQLNAYSVRVLDGIRSETLQRDDSARYRQHEIRNLERAFLESPVVGHGFGYAYQPPRGKAGSFWFDQAPYYSHNFYWWTLAKTGFIGFALVLMAFLMPLALALARGPQRSSLTSATAPCFAGLLAVSWVAPLPINALTSLLMGGILGVLVASLRMPELADHPFPNLVANRTESPPRMSELQQNLEPKSD